MITARMIEHELRPLEGRAPSVIPVPEFHPEGFDISGFIFSRRFLKAANNIAALNIPTTERDWQELMRHAKLAKSLESDSDGGPTIGRNRILIKIAGNNETAGSETDYIYLYIGKNHRIKLWGSEGTRFPKGHTLGWDLNDIGDFLETIPTDDWDNIFLESPSGDGMLLQRIFIEHSSQTIIDWHKDIWLDGSKKEPFGRIGLIAQILEKKLSYVDHSWIPQIHIAAREIGKTDWRKYGDGSVWCSEFASWCLHEALWDVPYDGSFGSVQLENWFNSQGRKYTQDDVVSGKYRLIPGDYLRINNGEHSVLFVSYLDGDSFTGPSSLTHATRIRTIEGNVYKTVVVKERTINCIFSVGSTA